MRFTNRSVSIYFRLPTMKSIFSSTDWAVWRRSTLRACCIAEALRRSWPRTTYGSSTWSRTCCAAARGPSRSLACPTASAKERVKSTSCETVAGFHGSFPRAVPAAEREKKKLCLTRASQQGFLRAGMGTRRLLAWLTEYSAQFGAAGKAEHSASFEARLRRYQRGFFTSK